MNKRSEFALNGWMDGWKREEGREGKKGEKKKKKEVKVM